MTTDAPSLAWRCVWRSSAPDLRKDFDTEDDADRHRTWLANQTPPLLGHVYLGVAVFSVESDEEAVDMPLSAGDYSGELRSERIDVGFRKRELPNQDWPDQEDA